MILLIIIIIVLGLILLIFNPYIDIFKDYREKYHMIFWYSYKGKRKYISIIGSQQ